MSEFEKSLSHVFDLYQKFRHGVETYCNLAGFSTRFRVFIDLGGESVFEVRSYCPFLGVSQPTHRIERGLNKEEFFLKMFEVISEHSDMLIKGEKQNQSLQNGCFNVRYEGDLNG